MIRVATAADYDEVEDKVYDFNTEFVGHRLDFDRLKNWFDLHITGGRIWLSDAGFLSSLVIQDPVRDRCVLMETAWYDTGRDGIRLVRELIKYGRDIEADEIRMSTLNTSPVGVTTLLRRMGFEEIERVHRLLL